MAGLVWQEPPQTVWPKGAEAYARAVRAGVHGVCQRYTVEISNWMKVNRPWTDRSSAAIQSLHSEVNPPTAAEVVGIIEVVMAHGVEYGTYLEGYLPDGTPMMRGPLYAVVVPALDRFGPLIWADIRRLFS